MAEFERVAEKTAEAAAAAAQADVFPWPVLNTPHGELTRDQIIQALRQTEDTLADLAHTLRGLKDTQRGQPRSVQATARTKQHADMRIGLRRLCCMPFSKRLGQKQNNHLA